MNRKQYQCYRARVGDFMAGQGLANLSAVQDAEPYFSSRPCDVCQRPLAGDREDCQGYVQPSLSNDHRGHVSDVYSVCIDCVYFLEYGQLDDETMLSVERDS